VVRHEDHSPNSGARQIDRSHMRQLGLPSRAPAGCRSASQLNPHDEASRLIDALELSGAQRNAARDFVIFEMARGGTPSAPLQRWGKKRVGIQCKPRGSRVHWAIGSRAFLA
jgi:hypothetical protein